jgi:hypothetical protein
MQIRRGTLRYSGTTTRRGSIDVVSLVFTFDRMTLAISGFAESCLNSSKKPPMTNNPKEKSKTVQA